MTEPDAEVLTRPPTSADRDAFLRSALASRDLHHPWIHPPLSPEEFALYLARFEKPDHESRLVCRTDTNELVGVINLNNIIRGYFENAFLGFYAFRDHLGKGLMQKGMRLVIEEAFGDLSLHRLEANVQPGNKRSLNFVRRAGFTREGYSRNYLFIDGAWRDHERWALVQGT